MLLDTPPQAVFDQFTSLTTKIFGVPVSLISVIDLDRQFFKSAFGLPEPVRSARETPLTHSFCRHVVAHNSTLAVPDSREDEIFRDNPSVRELGVVAYAGAPVRDADGVAFAALCAIDSRPREWSGRELQILEMLAGQVTREVALREILIDMGVDALQTKSRDEMKSRIGRADRHDLRTPLGALLLSLEAVREVGALNPDQIQFLGMAESSIETVLGMVDSLIDIGSVDSRGAEAMTFRPTEVRPLVESARAQVALLAREKNIELAAETEEDTFLLDGPKFLRVLVNLLANGIKFTPAGGMVRLRAEFSGQGLRITVSDSGIGISPEELELIFTEGYRVDKDARTRRSTGLGLTFCQRIVLAHRGTIQVESELGRGTVFTIFLPGTEATPG